LVCVLRFSRTFLGKNAQFQNMCAKKTQWFSTTKKIFQSREVQNRRNYQSSWITWPIRLWLLWWIVLWKESLCKTWIVILIKCICFIIKINHMWSRVKKHCFKKQKQTLFTPKTHCFPKKPIVFQHVHFFIPLFWNEKLSLHTSILFNLTSAFKGDTPFK